MACALTPFKDLTYLERGKEKLVVEACLREGLKVCHNLYVFFVFTYSFDTQLGIQDHFLDGIPVLFEADKVISVSELKDLSHPLGERVALGV